MVVRSSNRDFIKSISDHMRHVADIPRLLLRIKKAEASFSEWCKIHSSLLNSLRIMENVLRFVDDDGDSRGDPDDVFFLQSICEPLDMQSIVTIISIMEDSIDFDREQEMGNAVVFIREGYDETLDMQRTLFENLEEVALPISLINAFHTICFPFSLCCDCVRRWWRQRIEF